MAYERVRGTWHFITYDADEAELLIKFCDNSHVQSYAYAKHTNKCSKTHWHFVFLFYHPISLYQIAVLSNTIVSYPVSIKGSFADNLRYLKSKGDVITNGRLSKTI